jgi:integrase/recombinase XerD
MSLRIPEVLSGEERAALYKTCNTRYKTGLRDLCELHLMADLGLRSMEILNLRWRDIDLNTGRVRVVQGKGGKDRIVWCDVDTVLPLMRRWRDVAHHSPLGLVFATRTGKRQLSQGLRAMVARRGKKAGIHKGANGRVHPHMLRHTAATDMYKATHNLMIVKSMLGHASVRTTEIYTHIHNHELQQAMQTYRQEREE